MAWTTAIDSEHVVPNPFTLAVEILYFTARPDPRDQRD